MKNEVDSYLDYAFKKDQREQLKDVVITDHVPKPRMFNTLNAEEDFHFFKYKKYLEEYNKDDEGPRPKSKLQGIFNYKKGSILQRVFNPLGGAEK